MTSATKKQRTERSPARIYDSQDPLIKALEDLTPEERDQLLQRLDPLASVSPTSAHQSLPSALKDLRQGLAEKYGLTEAEVSDLANGLI
jgi:hypothetical protein